VALLHRSAAAVVAGVMEALDLHGMTVAQAVTATRKALRTHPPRTVLKFISGRGVHSAGPTSRHRHTRLFSSAMMDHCWCRQCRESRHFAAATHNHTHLLTLTRTHASISSTFFEVAPTFDCWQVEFLPSKCSCSAVSKGGY
jgi:hypothetical protein